MKSRAALSEEERKEREEEEEAVVAAFLGRTSTEGIRRPASSAAHNGEGEDVREKVEFLLKTEEERTALAARNAASGGQAVSGLDDLLPLSFAVSQECPHSSCQITTDGPCNLPKSLSLADASAKKPKRRKKVVEKREWAHVVDVKQNLMNFDELVPDMAFKVRLRSGWACNRRSLR